MIPTLELVCGLINITFFLPFICFRVKTGFSVLSHDLPTPQKTLRIWQNPTISYNSNLRLISLNKELYLAPCLVLYCTVV